MKTLFFKRFIFVFLIMFLIVSLLSGVSNIVGSESNIFSSFHGFVKGIFEKQEGVSEAEGSGGERALMAPGDAINWSNASIIFLHHSTGEGVYFGGDVPQSITDYNQQHNTNFKIFERNYPDTPWPWANYPYDYWSLWINGDCDNSNDNIACMDKLARDYNVIIFKHCFPGAAMVNDPEADVSSPEKTMGNYRLQYRALRNMMDNYPNTIFIIWTLAPLNERATNPESAALAKEFVDWVKTDFLNEDGRQHPNIFIYDFFSLMADPATNMLRVEYQWSPDTSDSHPSAEANEIAGPVFSGTIINSILNFSRRAGLPLYSSFGGSTTNFNSVPNISEVSNAVLEKN